MPKQSYALERGGLRRLEISWGMFWRNVTVTLDGNVLGTVPGQSELAAGQDFPMPDGSTLTVRLVSTIISSELQVRRNGEPLPGSAADPLVKHKTAYVIVYGIGALNLVLGVLSLILQVEILENIGIGFYTLAFGLGFILLGYFTQRRSSLALMLAIGLFGLDAGVNFILTLMAGGSPSIVGVFLRVILIIPMVQGVAAIRALYKPGM
jgi:hypothetical protein